MINCWYKLNDIWKTGFFHQWSQSYEEFETGPGNFPAAIIEDATDSHCHVVYAGHVSFNPNHPDAPNATLVKAAKEYKSHRFTPRLVEIGDWRAVQVHPEVIELFYIEAFMCQVKWIDGEVRASRGGIPVDQLREMFKRSEHGRVCDH